MFVKHGDRREWGWGVTIRSKYDYFLPDDWYEALLSKMVCDGTVWCDVGCGRDIFPNNHRLASILSERSRQLVGIDPDENIEENPYLSKKFRCTLDEFVPSQKFNLVTLRMVIEHVVNPRATVDVLSDMVDRGGMVVVYTVRKWSPISVITKLSPKQVIHGAKSVLFETEERDTFPVAYRMNTKDVLNRIFSESGFKSVYYKELDDCSVFARFRVMHQVDLAVRKYMTLLRIKYPERNMLSVFERL